MSSGVPRRLAVALTVALAITGLWATSTADPALSAYNPSWDGSSTLRQEVPPAGTSVVVGEQTATYAAVSPPETTAFVLSPDRRYTDDEAAQLRRFVRDGGTLVIAEDFGPHADPLLDRVGASTRVDGRPLRDEHSYYRSPGLAVATGVTPSPLTAGVEQLTLNRGTALEPHGARVLVESSSLAYLDDNANASLDATETVRPYPVVTAERLGDGQVVVVADPSLFINAMLERPGNRRFALALTERSETVLLDYSHAEAVPPLVRAALAVRRSPALQTVGVFAAVGLVVLLARRFPTTRTRQATDTVSRPGGARRSVSADRPIAGVISSDEQADDE